MIRIVVVDDEERLGKAFCEILAMHGFEAHFVQRADEAVSYINKIGAVAIISDFFMPVMNGDKLVGEIHKECPTIHFVAIFSGKAGDKEVKEAAEKIRCPLFRKVEDDKLLLRVLKDVFKN